MTGIEQGALRIPDPHPGGRGFLDYWVTEQLHAEPRPVQRRSLFRKCHRCKQVILVGLDADLCAFRTEADPTPLTARQEYACYLVGRRTYDAVVVARAVELTHRDAAMVAAPEANHWAVVPAHQCGARFAGFIIPPMYQPDHTKAPF